MSASTEIELPHGTKVVHSFPLAYCVAAGRAWAEFAIPPMINRLTRRPEEGYLVVYQSGFKPGDWASVYYVIRPTGVQERVAGPPPVFET